MDKDTEFLINSGWISKEDFKIVINNDVKNCINRCNSPEKGDIFNAFKNLKLDDIKLLIIGQDPYPENGKADGMAFSYKTGSIPASDSLRNIFSEIIKDYSNYTEKDFPTRNLNKWKEQGILLLNTALTYSKNNNSKTQQECFKAWKPFVNCIIKKIINKKKSSKEPFIIMLWGRKANELKSLKFGSKSIYQKEINGIFYDCIKESNIFILRSSHPSNMYDSCNKNIFKGKVKAFNGCFHFKQCNDILNQYNIEEIYWGTK